MFLPVRSNDLFFDDFARIMTHIYPHAGIVTKIVSRQPPCPEPHLLLWNMQCSHSVAIAILLRKHCPSPHTPTLQPSTFTFFPLLFVRLVAHSFRAVMRYFSITDFGAIEAWPIPQSLNRSRKTSRVENVVLVQGNMCAIVQFGCGHKQHSSVLKRPICQGFVAWHK